MAWGCSFIRARRRWKSGAACPPPSKSCERPCRNIFIRRGNHSNEQDVRCRSLGECSLPFLVGNIFCFRDHGGEPAERLHSSHAPGAKHCPSAFTLPSLQIFYPLVPECAAFHMVVSPRQMRQLPQPY